MSTATFTISNIGDNPVTITGITFNTPSGISHVADLTNLGGSSVFTGTVASLSYNLNYPNSQTFTVNHTTNTGVLTASTLASTIVINGSSGTSATITVTDVVTTSTNLVSPTTATFYSYTIPGTYYLAPPYRYATATIIGGGGGGGGNDGGGDNWAGGGGGSGAYTVSYLDFNNTGSLEIVVGAGGLPASVTYNGYAFPGIEGKIRTGTKAGGTGGTSFVFWTTSGYYYSSFATGGGGGSGNTSDARYNITGGAGGSTSGTGLSQNGIKGEDVTRPTFERNNYRAAYGGAISGITTGTGGNSHDSNFGTNLDIHLPQGGGDGAVFLLFSNTNPAGGGASIVSNFGKSLSCLNSYNGRSDPAYTMVKITSDGGFILDISTSTSLYGSGIYVYPSPAVNQRWAAEPSIGGSPVSGGSYYVRARVDTISGWTGNAYFTGPGFSTVLEDSYFQAYGYGVPVQGSWVTVTTAASYINAYGAAGWRLDNQYRSMIYQPSSASMNLTIEISNTTTGVILASGSYQCNMSSTDSYAGSTLNPPAGTILLQGCDGLFFRTIYADGSGGTYISYDNPNNVDCGGGS
jgi:hypothetical protein